MHLMKSRSFNVMIVLALLLSLLGGALTATPARAASIVVNTNADNTTSADGFCTLREAITNANNNSDTTSDDCAAGSGADTITFAADYTITLAGSQLPAVNSDITINGNGATKTIIQANAAANAATYRVLEVRGTPGSSLTLDGVTIRHGVCAGGCAVFVNLGGGIFNEGILTITNSTIANNSTNFRGGGIYSSGTVTITNSTVSNNSATGGEGGGMYNVGTLTIADSTFSGNLATYGGGMYNLTSSPTISNSTFSGNSATDNGGGMHNTNGSSPTISNTTFSGNSAFSGGGMYNNNSNPTISNSTFSGNSANDNGGGMHNTNGSSPTISNTTFSGNSAFSGGGMYNNNSNPTISNSTFSGNSANGIGGGMYNFSSSPTLKNTIIANSTGGDCRNGPLGLINAASSHNLIESTGTDACGITASFGGGNNIVGSDPALNALANNGGFTQTMALQAGSLAIDTGDTTTCNNAPVSGKDQRGVTRPLGAGCDIGAYEAGAIIPIVTASNPSAGATLTSLSSITVVFNQDMLDNATADGAENVNNYILVERGANAAFDTTSCAGGVVSDDVPQTISTASYNSAGFVTSLTLASPLTAGTYRLFVCGTTSIWSVAGLELNNGASDYTADFTINAAGTGSPIETENTRASALPATGFAPKTITTLPKQPATLAYANIGDIVLEIPSLNVKSTIVGVPQNADKTWSVDWLGNDTGWLNGTAFPTWTGNSVLTAHVTNASGLEGPFAALKQLKYGDQIIVHMGGVQYIYEVRATKLSRPYSTNYAFESKQDASYLTLITCAGYNPLNESYLFRRVVRAVLVEVK